MAKDNFLPITIEICHEANIDCLIIEGKMKQDFGSWKKDEHTILTFDFENGKITKYNDVGVVIESVDIVLDIK